MSQSSAACKTDYARDAAAPQLRGAKNAMPVFDETQSTWSHIVPAKTSVDVQIAFCQPLQLTWEQFADLANCCKDLSERTTESSARFGSVSIQINHPNKAA